MRFITWGLVALLAAVLLKMQIKPAAAGLAADDPRCKDFTPPMWSPGMAQGWFRSSTFGYCGWALRRVAPSTGMDKNGEPAYGAPNQSFPTQTGKSDPDTGENASDFYEGFGEGWGWADELVDDVKALF